MKPAPVEYRAPETGDVAVALLAQSAQQNGRSGHSAYARS